MQRLLADATKLSGVEYNIDNLSDVYEAIHVIQTDLGLTGVAAAEASTTFTGSFQAMKASAQNLLGAIALGENVQPALQSLVNTTATFLVENFIPMVANIIGSIPSIIVTGVQALASMDWAGIATQILTALSTAMTEGINALTVGADMIGHIEASITENLPTVLERGVEIVTELANGILENLPQLITTGGEMIASLVGFIMENLPTVVAAGATLMMNLIQGIINNLPNIISAMANVMLNLLSTILAHYPEYLKKGVEIVTQLATGLLDAIPKALSAILQVLGDVLTSIAGKLPEFAKKGGEIIVELAKGLVESIHKLVEKIPQVFREVKQAFTDQDWIGIGKNIMSGVADGIKKCASTIVDAAKNAAKSALDAAKNFLGIHSPSRVFRDQVGKMIPAGLAVGIEKNLDPISDAMKMVKEATLSSVNANIATTLTGSTSKYGHVVAGGVEGGGFVQNITVNSPRELSPSEIARQTRNATRNMVLALR